MTIEESWPHGHSSILPFLFTELIVLLNVFIHLTKHLLLLVLGRCLKILITELLYHIKVVTEFFELVLAHRCPQIYHESNRDCVEYVLV